MSTQYHAYIVKDSHGGASLKNYPEDYLIISESDVFALDIEHCPSLKHIIIKQLKPATKPHIRLFNVPALERMDIATDIEPAIIYHAGYHQHAALNINGKIEAVDMDINGIGFCVTHPVNGNQWDGFRIVSASEAQAFNQQDHLLLVQDNGEQAPECLTLHNQNDWVLHNLNTRTLQADTHGQLHLLTMPALQSLTVNACSQLCIHQASNLQQLNGNGRIAKIDIDQHGTGTLAINGIWDSVSLNTPKLTTLQAPKVKNLLIIDASDLKTVDLALNTPVECLGMLPVALNQSARFYFHENSVRKMLEQLSLGNADILPSLLNILPQAAYRNQVRHSLNALKDMCDLFMPAEQIWAARNELLLNNLRMYGKGTFGDAKKMLPDNNVPWCWTMPADLYHEGIMADLRIWEYCANSQSQAMAYIKTMRHEADKIHLNPVLIHCISASDTSTAIYTLAADLISHYSDDNDVKKYLRAHTNLPHNLNRLLYAIKKSAAYPAIQRQVLHATVNLLNKDHFMQHIGALYDLKTEVIRSELVRIATEPNAWFYGFFTKGLISHDSLQRRAEKIRKSVMLLAMSPANTTQLSAQEAH